MLGRSAIDKRAFSVEPVRVAHAHAPFRTRVAGMLGRSAIDDRALTGEAVRVAHALIRERSH